MKTKKDILEWYKKNYFSITGKEESERQLSVLLDELIDSAPEFDDKSYDANMVVKIQEWKKEAKG